MTEKMLNLIADIHDKLGIYNTVVSPVPGGDHDYIITIDEKYIIDEFSTDSMDLSFIDEHRRDYDTIDIRTGVNEDGVPDVGEDVGVGSHWAELRVRE